MWFELCGPPAHWAARAIPITGKRRQAPISHCSNLGRESFTLSSDFTEITFRKYNKSLCLWDWIGCNDYSAVNLPPNYVKGSVKDHVTPTLVERGITAGSASKLSAARM